MIESMCHMMSYDLMPAIKDPSKLPPLPTTSGAMFVSGLHPNLAAVVAGRRMGKPKELPSLKHSLELLDSNLVGKASKGSSLIRASTPAESRKFA